MGHLGVVRRLFVIAGFVMLRGLALVLGRLLVVMRSPARGARGFHGYSLVSPWQQSRCKLQSPLQIQHRRVRCADKREAKRRSRAHGQNRLPRVANKRNLLIPHVVSST